MLKQRTSTAERQEAEARHILATRGGKYAEAEDLLSRQLDIVVNRSSNLLGLATVVLTITGFSGPTIAKTSVLSAVAMGLGLLLTLASLTVVMLGSFKLRWSSQFFFASAQRLRAQRLQQGTALVAAASAAAVELQQPAEDATDGELRRQPPVVTEDEVIHDTLTEIISFRDTKQRMCNAEMVLLCLGLLCYVVSFLDYIIENTWPRALGSN